MDFDIAIFYREDTNQQDVLSFVDELRNMGVKVSTEERERFVYTSLEWATPALIIAYLTKPYVETILQEVAKDHYKAVKKVFAKFAAKHLRQKGQKLISSATPNKGKTETKISNTFAVWSTTVDGRPNHFC